MVKCLDATLLNVELLKLIVSLSVVTLLWAHRFDSLLLLFLLGSNAYYVKQSQIVTMKNQSKRTKLRKVAKQNCVDTSSTRNKSDGDVIRRHWRFVGVMRSCWRCLYHLYVKKLAPTCSLTVPLREITPKNSRLFSPSCALLSTRSRLAAPRRHSSSGI